MIIDELTPEMITELKQRYYMTVLHPDDDVSWDELANVDELVTMEQLCGEYGYIDFSEDDLL